MKFIKNFETADAFATWKGGEDVPEVWVAYSQDDEEVHFSPVVVSYWITKDKGTVTAAALQSLYNLGKIASSEGITDAERETLGADYAIKASRGAVAEINKDELNYANKDPQYFYYNGKWEYGSISSSSLGADYDELENSQIGYLYITSEDPDK